MKSIFFIITLIFTTSSFARDLYPEEYLKLPSDSYQLVINKSIKMTDTRKRIIFYKGKIVKTLPVKSNIFFCELTNMRSKKEKIQIDAGTSFFFDNKDGSMWKHFVTGRIWLKRLFIKDNGPVQYFSCNDTDAFQNDYDSSGVSYHNIKGAVGSYLEIILN